ncbi:hypothetical protein [Methylorubrum extorquens]
MSAFALRQASQEQASAALTESFWNDGLQARGLAQCFGAALPAIEESPWTDVPSPWMMRPAGSGRDD